MSTVGFSNSNDMFVDVVLEAIDYDDFGQGTLGKNFFFESYKRKM